MCRILLMFDVSVGVDVSLSDRCQLIPILRVCDRQKMENIVWFGIRDAEAAVAQFTSNHTNASERST